MSRWRARKQLVGAIVLSILLLGIAGPAGAQLFESLEAFGRRLRAGDPELAAAGFFEGPKGIAAGDLDRDGLADLAVSNLDGTVTVFLNAGGGEFAEPRHFPTGARTLRGIAVSDLSGDGWLDIAAAAPFEGTVFLFVNDAGAFPPPLEIPAGEGARELVAGDLDGTGRPGLAAAGPGLGLRQYRLGDAGLEVLGEVAELAASSGECFPKPVYPLALLREPAGLVATHAWSDQVWILAPGPGPSGALAVAGSVPVVASGAAGELARCSLPARNGVYSLDTGPLTSPRAGGQPDLVTAQRNLGTIQIRRGVEGPQRFAAAVHQEIQVPGAPRVARIVDLDGDGWNDLVVVLRNLDRVLTYRNDGEGTLEPAHEIPVGRSPRDMVAADFDRDGTPDLAVINRLSSDVSLLRGHPTAAGFSALDGLYLVDGEVVALELADLDGDGRDDVIQLHRAAGEISIRLAGEGGRLAAAVFYPMGVQPSALKVLDLNGDGNLDMATADLGRREVEDGGISVRLGDGRGGLGPLAVTRLPDRGGLFALEAEDLNGDGKVDLAAGYFDCRLGLFQGRGDGTFTLTGVHFFVPEARAMATGDFDGDGDVDLAGAGYQGTLAVVENPGDLLAAAELSVAEYPPPTQDKFRTRDLEATDLNGDGDLDLIVGSGRGVMVYLGREGLRFELSSAALPGTDFPASSVAEGDFDGDGDGDLAVACQVLACVSVLTRSPEGDFVPALSVDAPAGRLLAAGDLDGDGHPDLAGSGEALWTALSSRAPQLSGPPVLEGGHPVLQRVVINEILPRNTAITVEGSPDWTPDWAELYNGGPDQDLGGWRVVLEVPGGGIQEYRLPPGTVLESGRHLVVVFSRREEANAPFRADFRLPASGGTLGLLDRGGATVDRVQYPEQPADHSFARYRDGLEGFITNPFPTLGAENVDNGTVEPEIALSGMSPVFSRPGEPVRFFAAARDDVGVVGASIVYRRLDEPGAPSRRLFLYDDGLHGDEGMLDGIFSNELAGGFPQGAEVEFYLEVDDLSDNVVTVPAGAYFRPGEEGSDVYSFAVGVDLPALELSEVLASNTKGITDETGARPDWVEIRNCSPGPVSLAGVYLSQSFPATENWFAFPRGQVLEPGEHLVVFCDGDPGDGPLHAPFRLEVEGDRLYLCGTAQRGAHVLYDALEFGPQLSDVALARRGCGGEWVAAQPTPGAANEDTFGEFLRGDCNGDGLVVSQVSDAVYLLRHNFAGGPRPLCLAACDANGDGRVQGQVTDAVYLLNFNFRGGSPPVRPFPDCGGATLSSDGALGCERPLQGCR